MSQAEKYKAQSIHYIGNALGAIKAGDAEKAGESLWGAMAEALKAVAASKGGELRAHWEIGDYARRLAKETGDESILNAFRDASYLHSNFYEAGLGMEEVYTYAERIRATVANLLSLIPEEA
jgi:hypothetical protein